MPAPIELALSTLLPTVSFLPPDLISLASSLLAQSRAKAASLKAEEEIARIYVCAHIACERSKKKLDLEVGKPMPPCKPRVYERLFAYLDGVLRTPGPRTPLRGGGGGFKDADVEGGGKEIKTSGSVKRVREEEEREVVKTPNGSKRLRVEEKDKEEDKDVPDFVMPMIRAICKATSVPGAAPHVHIGAQAVVREIISRNQKLADPPSRKRRRTTTPQSAKSTASASEHTGTLAMARWPALVLALFCLTATKLRGLEDGDAEVEKIRNDGTGVIKTFCAERGDVLPEAVDARLRSLDADVRFYLLEAEESGWLEMEWYQNIPTSQDGEDEIVEDEEDEDETTVTPKRNQKLLHKTPLQRKEKYGGKIADRMGSAGLLPGLGTMFSSAIDWLSDDRRAEYAHWKEDILKEIAIVEQRA